MFISFFVLVLSLRLVNKVEYIIVWICCYLRHGLTWTAAGAWDPLWSFTAAGHGSSVVGRVERYSVDTVAGATLNAPRTARTAVAPRRPRWPVTPHCHAHTHTHNSNRWIDERASSLISIKVEIVQDCRMFFKFKLSDEILTLRYNKFISNQHAFASLHN